METIKDLLNKLNQLNCIFHLKHSIDISCDGSGTILAQNTKNLVEIYYEGFDSLEELEILIDDLIEHKEYRSLSEIKDEKGLI